MLHRQLQQPLPLNKGITGGFAIRGEKKVVILYFVMAEISAQSHRLN